MKPSESVLALYGLYAKTVEHLGESGWEPVPHNATVTGITPQQCDLSSGSRGVQYSDARIGPGTADAASSAENVAAFWKNRGLATVTSRSSNPKDDRIKTTGSKDDLKAEYVVNKDRSYISIITTCVPGDWTKLVKGVEEHRAAESANPTSPAG